MRCLLILMALRIMFDKVVYHGANVVATARMMNELTLQSKSSGKEHLSLWYFYCLNSHWKSFWSATLNFDISASSLLCCPLCMWLSVRTDFLKCTSRLMEQDESLPVGLFMFWWSEEDKEPHLMRMSMHLLKSTFSAGSNDLIPSDGVFWLRWCP